MSYFVFPLFIGFRRAATHRFGLFYWLKNQTNSLCRLTIQHDSTGHGHQLFRLTCRGSTPEQQNNGQNEEDPCQTDGK